MDLDNHYLGLKRLSIKEIILKLNKFKFRNTFIKFKGVKIIQLKQI